jgi:hypothetical protein
VRRPALVLVGLLLACAAPAHAAGTGDVELVPASRDGAPQTSFRVTPDDDALRFELVNLADEPRTARLYAASADRSEGGGIGIGATGSAPWLQLPDAEIVLAGGETRAFTAPLDLRALPEQREQLGAVVLEAPQGAVTIRVATLVTVEPRPALPLPLWAVALAVITLGLALFGLWVARRRRRDEAEPAPDRELVGV